MEWSGCFSSRRSRRISRFMAPNASRRSGIVAARFAVPSPSPTNLYSNAPGWAAFHFGLHHVETIQNVEFEDANGIQNAISLRWPNTDVRIETHCPV